MFSARKASRKWTHVRCPWLGFDCEVGLVDPFVQVLYGGMKGKTRHIEKDQNPSWNETITLPIVFPAFSDVVEVQVFDYDAVSSFINQQVTFDRSAITT
jgi:hypothetical protein